MIINRFYKIKLDLQAAKSFYDKIATVDNNLCKRRLHNKVYQINVNLFGTKQLVQLMI